MCGAPLGHCFAVSVDLEHGRVGAQQFASHFMVLYIACIGLKQCVHAVVAHTALSIAEQVSVHGHLSYQTCQ